MISVKNLCVGYGDKSVLNDISFEIPHVSITGVIGKNGSGKSTLVGALCARLKCTGSILIGGEDVFGMNARQRAQHISVLPQKLGDVTCTVKELVYMGRNPYISIGKRIGDTDRQKVDNAIKILGIEGLSDVAVNRLSGGERQKAYLAMILAQDTELIILDEPTSFIDIEYTASFMNLLKELKEKHGKTVIIVIHDINSVLEYADNILALQNGKTAFYGTVSECIKSGVIERVFNVRRVDYTEDGISKSFYK